MKKITCLFSLALFLTTFSHTNAQQNAIAQGSGAARGASAGINKNIIFVGAAVAVAAGIVVLAATSNSYHSH